MVIVALPTVCSAGNVIPDEAPVQNYDGDDCNNALPISSEEANDTVYQHPDAQRLFNFFPCFAHVPIVGSAVEAFGPKCVFALGMVYVMSKGIGRNLITFSLYAIFMKKYNVSDAVYQRTKGLSSMGFSVKPLTAIFSDAVSLLGYTKRYYMLLSCIVGAICTIVYGLLPERASSAPIAGAMIFIVNFCIANVDVLSEGHYSRLIKRFPSPGANLISWIWALIMVGTIIGSAIQGPLSDTGVPRIGIFISAGLQLICSLFYIMNWYEEKTNRAERAADHAFLLAEFASKHDVHSLDSCEDNVKTVGMIEESDNTTQRNVTTTGEDNNNNNNINNNGDVALMELDEFNPLYYHSTNEQTNEVSVTLTQELNVTNITKMSDKSNAVALLDNQSDTSDDLITSCCNGFVEVNTEVIKRNTIVAFYGILMTCGVLIITILNLIGDTYDLLYGSMIVSGVLCISGFFCIPITIMKANLFGWLQLVLYVTISGVMDNFYLADSSCLPDGPHFSQSFYNTVGTLIGNIAGLFGVYMFAQVFSKRNYRITFIITVFVQVIASIFDLVIVERWNVKIGIPDHAMYILGDAIVYEVCYYLSYMPMNMLIFRLCPKGCESTMFAILASFSNLGGSMSNVLGSILIETVLPVRSKEPCDFSNLRWLIIGGHMIAPLLCLPFVFLLIPGTRISDEIDSVKLDEMPVAVTWFNKYKTYKTKRKQATHNSGNAALNGLSNSITGVNEPI